MSFDGFVVAWFMERVRARLGGMKGVGVVVLVLLGLEVVVVPVVE